MIFKKNYMKIGYRFKMIREQRVGLLFLLAFIIGAEIYIHRDSLFYGKVEKESLPLNIQNIINSENQTDSKPILTTYFNPNAYSEADWQHIGFSKKQASIIIKYKNLVGGHFVSKEQLKQCFVISEEKYNELAPFIQLPEKITGNKTDHPTFTQYTLKKFNPNSFILTDWKNIGFTQKQAEVIIKYKELIGGKFISKDQLKKCFVISESKYKELAPFIELPENINQNNQTYTNTTYTLSQFNPNQFNSLDWQKIGFTQKQAESILKYKKSIGGIFISKDQIKKCFIISEEKYKELAPFIQLPEKINKNEKEKFSIDDKTIKYTLSKFNPNLYSSADWQKIGFSQKQAEVIIKYKNKLGGRFTSKQQIKQCFVISENKFNEIEPYIQF